MIYTGEVKKAPSEGSQAMMKTYTLKETLARGKEPMCIDPEFDGSTFCGSETGHVNKRGYLHNGACADCAAILQRVASNSIGGAYLAVA
jgi:hypothetical protein